MPQMPWNRRLWIVRTVFAAPTALEPEVVDRQDSFRGADRRIPELGPLVQRHQGGLPVVAVDHIRRPFQVVQDRQGGFGEEAVFRNVFPQARIRVAPVEELTVLDKVVGHAVHLHLHDAHEEGSSLLCLVHHEGSLVFQLVFIFLGNAGIQRKDDPHFASFADQGPGQRVHHVAQAARLDKRVAFRPDKGYLALRVFRHGFHSSCVFCRSFRPAATRRCLFISITDSGPEENTYSPRYSIT